MELKTENVSIFLFTCLISLKMLLYYMLDDPFGKSKPKACILVKGFFFFHLYFKKNKLGLFKVQYYASQPLTLFLVQSG